MKKFFMFAAMASVALVSCVKNEPSVSLNDNQTAIKFAAPVMSPNVKAATEIADNYPTTEKFAVWAYYYDKTTDNEAYNNFAGGEVYMNEVVVSYDGTSTWKAAQIYYWPKNGSLTFAAYSPADNALNTADKFSYTAQGLQIAGYVVPADDAEQKDLLFSDRTYDLKANNDVNEVGDTDPYTGVTMNFKHALSSIVFRAKTDIEYNESPKNTKISIENITLTNINSVGTFNQNLDDSKENPQTYVIDMTALTGYIREWSALGTPISYVAHDEGEILLSKDPIYLYNNDADATENATDLMLLPQVISDDAKVVVTYYIDNGTAKVKQVSEVDLKTALVGEWIRGIRYTYVLTIGLDEITFEPKVAPWADYGTDVEPEQI